VIHLLFWIKTLRSFHKIPPLHPILRHRTLLAAGIVAGCATITPIPSQLKDVTKTN
jgi:hypothetical protein